MQPPQQTHVHTDVEALCIPGLSLLLEYVSPAEEAALLACVDAQPWERAAARRVQHYGRRFSYVVRVQHRCRACVVVAPSSNQHGTHATAPAAYHASAHQERGVASQPAPLLPADIAAVAHRASTERLLQGHSVRGCVLIHACTDLCVTTLQGAGGRRHQPHPHQVDQVTVNEYTPGVGFTAHVDTHSAFQGAVLSLSLAGHTVLELRRPGSEARALLLPQRSLLVMADEARLGWWVVGSCGLAGCVISTHI